MSWSINPATQANLSDKIYELARIPDRLERYHAALSWIEYCSAYPELAGDRPIDYFATLVAYVQDPTIIDRVDKVG